jgi:hypothetical protein
VITKRLLTVGGFLFVLGIAFSTVHFVNSSAPFGIEDPLGWTLYLLWLAIGVGLSAILLATGGWPSRIAAVLWLLWAALITWFFVSPARVAIRLGFGNGGGSVAILFIALVALGTLVCAALITSVFVRAFRTREALRAVQEERG